MGGAVSGSLDCIPQTLPPVIQLVVFVRHKSPSSLKPTPQMPATLSNLQIPLLLFSALLLFPAQTNPTRTLLAGLNTPCLKIAFSLYHNILHFIPKTKIFRVVFNLSAIRDPMALYSAVCHVEKQTLVVRSLSHSELNRRQLQSQKAVTAYFSSFK